jgi:transcriptional antiterminator RfaH
MSYWACAQTEPHREAAATHFLGLAGYQVYCPRLRLIRPRRGRKVVSHPPLFPGYLFVAIVAGWWNARWCPGIVKLLANGDAPMPVPESLIAEIKGRERGGLVELPKPPSGLHVGDKVRITAGAFSGHLGLYQGMRPHERVLVLLTLLGGQSRVELGRAAIEPVRS